MSDEAEGDVGNINLEEDADEPESVSPPED